MKLVRQNFAIQIQCQSYFCTWCSILFVQRSDCVKPHILHGWNAWDKNFSLTSPQLSFKIWRNTSFPPTAPVAHTFSLFTRPLENTTTLLIWICSISKLCLFMVRLCPFILVSTFLYGLNTPSPGFFGIFSSDDLCRFSKHILLSVYGRRRIFFAPLVREDEHFSSFPMHLLQSDFFLSFFPGTWVR